MPVGRPRSISSPEELLQHFEAYRTWAKETPYLWHDYVGKEADEVWKKRERPVTWIGFEAWLYREGIITQLTQYEQNLNEAYTEFLPTIRAIKRQISSDIVEGALAGVYNQNIAARIEGLTDKRDIDLSAKVDFRDAE